MEETKWEKPKLIVISSAGVSENVLDGSAGQDPRGPGPYDRG
jgi:hypothetical protein